MKIFVAQLKFVEWEKGDDVAPPLHWVNHKKDKMHLLNWRDQEQRACLNGENGKKYKEFSSNERKTSLLMKMTQTLTATADWEIDKNLLLRLRREVRVASWILEWEKTNEFMIKKITGFSSKCNWAWFQFQVFISRLSHFSLLLFDIFCDYITSLYTTTSLCRFHLLLAWVH